MLNTDNVVFFEFFIYKFILILSFLGVLIILKVWPIQLSHCDGVLINCYNTLLMQYRVCQKKRLQKLEAFFLTHPVYASNVRALSAIQDPRD